MQVQIKHLAKESARQFGSKTSEYGETSLSLKLKENENQLVEAKKKTLQVAQDQIIQANIKRAKEAEEKKNDRQAGLELARLDKEYRKEQKELEKKKKAESIFLNEELQKMRQEIHDRKRELKLKEVEEDRKTQSWVVRKNKQNELKKEIEKKWFE